MEKKKNNNNTSAGAGESPDLESWLQIYFALVDKASYLKCTIATQVSSILGMAISYFISIEFLKHP